MGKGFGFTGRGLMKAVIYTLVILIILGIVKVSAPDFWAKIPGLKEF